MSPGATPGAALTGGFQWAFWVCAAIAAVAVPIGGLVIPRRTAEPPEPAAEPIPAAAETVVSSAH